MGNKVIFFGYKEDVVFVYSLLDVLVLPSLSEASPMSLFEAQSLKVPIIGSNIPSISEFVDQKNDLLFNPNDAKDLSTKIALLVSKKKSLSHSGHVHKVLQDHSLRKYLDELYRIYRYE
jgi:glycosyltransferase involved in cell wall biosynthesis